MRCRAARKLLSRRLDGRLAPAGAAMLRDHLVRCPGCTVEAVRLERAWASLETLPPAPTAPDDFSAVLEGTLTSRPTPAGFLEALGWRPRRAWALALAASILAGVATGVTLGRAAFGARRAAPEALALSEEFGVLPFGSPAAGLASAFVGRTE